MRSDLEPSPKEGLSGHNEPKGEARVIQFGAFDLRLETGELRRSGIRVRLQSQPFQILRALLERPGNVVTREELRQRLWPGDTYVDFESGLNTAANRLRAALCDSADEPLYIETLARVGYRFIAPVRISGEEHGPLQIANGTFDSALASISIPPAGSIGSNSRLISKYPAWTSFRAGLLALAILLPCLAWIVPGVWHGRTSPVFQQVTFRRGVLSNARFTPSGEVIYSARWQHQPGRIYLTDISSPESRDLQFGSAELAALSNSSTLAILSGSPDDGRQLQLVPLHGGAPRVLEKGVVGADWAPDGNGLCVIRRNRQAESIEFPPGKVLYRSSGWLESPRFSPRGDQVAFIEHSIRADDGGGVLTVDTSGKVRHRSDGWASIAGLAWHGTGGEIWFAAAKSGVARQVYAVSPSGRVRDVASIGATLELFDIDRKGRVLVGRSSKRLNLYEGSTASAKPKDISWFDWSHAAAISADGKQILFDESGEGGGPKYAVYLHNRDHQTTERIADGRAMDLSPSGDWVLTASRTNPSELALVSIADSQKRSLVAPGMSYQSARFLPDKRRIIAAVNKAKEPVELYFQTTSSGQMQLVKNGTDLYDFVPSPSGRLLAARAPDHQLAILDLEHQERRLIPVERTTRPVAWSGEDSVVIVNAGSDDLRFQKLNIATGEKREFLRLPVDPDEIQDDASSMLMSQDLSAFAYSNEQNSTDLLVVDGWH